MDKDTLSQWILKALEGGLSEVLNEDVETGICAYRNEKKLIDGKYYEFHFIYRKDGSKITHIGSTIDELEDSFNYRGVGVSEKLKDPNRKPTFNKDKLEKLCKKIIERLDVRGDFKLIIINNGNFDIVSIK